MSNHTEDLVERLAGLAHEQWSGWMKYLFTKGVQNEDGTFTMDKNSVERWRRQMSTSYSDLPDDEQKSDRKEAIGMLSAFLGVECRTYPHPDIDDTYIHHFTFST